MLQLKNVTKDYLAGENVVHALKGVSVNFRKSEFVSILGASGCGKTTLLNIVGGLDRYTKGDIIINGVSTVRFKDRDWDLFRNCSVGFVFQSYNLIPHQTVLKNVELALTLSGTNKVERKKRAEEALSKVGLKEQINKLPNQLSGGQMQRVAIARAIVNSPDIILADEPTGALDSETSVQVLDILKELSKTCLVVMVTHNSELAKTYSTRVITLSDGLMVADSAPFSDEELKKSFEQEKLLAKSKSINTKTDKRDKPKKVKKPSMSFLTALSLSLNNLFTKKARTILTSFAGSIGIIGIALILSLSSGFNNYIDTVQRDTLSNYPVRISTQTTDTAGLLSTFMGNTKHEGEEYPETESVTSQNVLTDLLFGFAKAVNQNDLKPFKEYLDKNASNPAISSIKYTYNYNLNAFYNNGTAIRQVSPASLPPASEVFPSGFENNELWIANYTYFETMMSSQPAFSEMIDDKAMLLEQYDVLSGEWPKTEPDEEGYYETIIAVDEYNQISDLDLYLMGLMSADDIKFIFTQMALSLSPEYKDKTDAELAEIIDKDYNLHRSQTSYTFEELKKLEWSIVLDSEYYEKIEPATVWTKKSNEAIEAQITDGNVLKLRVSGIVRKKKSAASGSLSSVVSYPKTFTEAIIARTSSQPIVQEHYSELEKFNNTQSGEAPEFKSVFDGSIKTTQSDWQAIATTLGIIDVSDPFSISIYPVDFEAKDAIVKLIDDYNATRATESEKIKYSDTIGLMMSSVTTIINAITYVLIAFVSISLIVSSIMIGVITYISVLERTKEIGILRSIGASKRDISRVFNAETTIVGFISGMMGIILTLVLIIPINLIIESLAGLVGIAALPLYGAIGLVAISMLLTIVAGIIPSRVASKKDPVVALRTD